MRKSRFSEAQIVGILKELKAGSKAADLCRKHGISEATLYAWRSKYGGLEASDFDAAQAARRRESPAQEDRRRGNLLRPAQRRAAVRAVRERLDALNGLHVVGIVSRDVVYEPAGLVE